MREKPVDLFNGTARTLTIAPAIILRTWVPLKKFPLLFNLQFFGLINELYNIQQRKLLQRNLSSKVIAENVKPCLVATKESLFFSRNNQPAVFG